MAPDRDAAAGTSAGAANSTRAPAARYGRLLRLARRAVLVSASMHWGTKSFEIWTFLLMLLALVRPRGVVELGSGRSTSYLAEYAMKTGVPFASIEQNRWYAAKIRSGLRRTFLSGRYVHHVPLAADGWYDGARLHRAVDFPCELLFVDGPVGVAEDLGPGRRGGERSLAWLLGAAAAARIVMVDDVHRRSNLEMFQRLLAANGDLRPLYVAYHVRQPANWLAVGVPAAALETLRQMCATVHIELRSEYSAAECSEA